MRLVNSELQLEILFEENKINILVLEDKLEYRKYLQCIWEQVQGKEGDNILSENDKAIAFSKMSVMVINPFNISCNEKKMLTKLYQDIKVLVLDNYYEEMSKICSDNIIFLDTVLNAVPYNMQYKFDIDVMDIFKVFDLHLEEEEVDFFEKIVSYIKLQARICNIKLFIFVGLKQYLKDEELELLYKEMFNEKVFLLDVETNIYRWLGAEKVFIIDKDKCVIELEGRQII